MDSLDKYLNIVNEEKVKRGLDNYSPLFPLLRKEDNKLYIGTLLTTDDDNVWEKGSNVKGSYWILIDPVSEKIVEFNKTEDRDFVIGDVIPKDIEDDQKEISKYTVKKALEYKEYFLNDIRNEELPLQKKLSNLLGTEIEVEGEKVSINDYIISRYEDNIKKHIDDFVKTLIGYKYGSYMEYYAILFNDIIDAYKKDKAIDIEKMKLCAEIMNNYYNGVTYIDNFFNIK